MSDIEELKKAYENKEQYPSEFIEQLIESGVDNEANLDDIFTIDGLFDEYTKIDEYGFDVHSGKILDAALYWSGLNKQKLTNEIVREYAEDDYENKAWILSVMPRALTFAVVSKGKTDADGIYMLLNQINTVASGEFFKESIIEDIKNKNQDSFINRWKIGFRYIPNDWHEYMKLETIKQIM